MKTLACPLFALFCCVALAADPTPDRIKKDIAEAEVTNAVILKTLIRQGKGQLLAMRNNAHPTEILIVKNTVKQLEATKPPRIPLLFPPYSAGDWGILWESTFEINQIIDDDEFIAEIGDQTVWLKGYNTENFADGEMTVLKTKATREDHTVVKISTTKYETVLGASKTVILIEPFDVEKYADDIWPAEPVKPAKKPAKAKPKVAKK